MVGSIYSKRGLFWHGSVTKAPMSAKKRWDFVSEY
jgi:hypothetical protein